MYDRKTKKAKVNYELGLGYLDDVIAENKMSVYPFHLKNFIEEKVFKRLNSIYLTDKEIKELTTWACDSFADNLMDNYDDWGVTANFGNLDSIGERMYSILLISLKIAKNAGMRKHRERSKNPYLRVSDQQQQQMIQGVL